MPIEELQEPIWEKQKGETPNQYCYFLEFLEYPTNNLKDFHQHLCNNDKLGQTGTKVPAYKTIRNWSGPACNKWTERKSAKRAAEQQDILDTLHELDKQDVVENFKTKKQIKNDLLFYIAAAIDKGLPLSQINQGMQALKTLHEDDLLDQEKPTNYNKTDVEADVRAEAEINREALDMMAKAYARGKDDYLNK